MNKKLLILIPSYNVEKFIKKVLYSIPKKLLKTNKVELLIVNDASTDNTLKILKKIKKYSFKVKIITNKTNRGYGGVQKIGFNYAIKNKFNIVALLHGDGQYKPQLLPKLIGPINKNSSEVVFGSRMLKPLNALKGNMPIYKFVGNIIITGIQNLFLISKMSEFHSGYRVYSVESLKKIPFNYNSNFFHFDTEIIIQLLFAKIKIKEIPIPTIYSGQISHLKGIKYSYNVIKITLLAMLHRFGILKIDKFK
mgnify:CR=1 FL=1